MDDKEFRRKLVSLVLPITFQQFMLAVVSACDALMVGVISQDLLSAVSLASQITFVYNLFSAALTIGTSMFAAQYWGKGDRRSIEKILGIVLRTSLGVSMVFFLAAVFFPDLLMKIFTADPILAEYGSGYLRIVGITYLLCGISQIYLCIMKNSGLAAKSMVISSTAAVLNIFLNAVLIYGLFGAPRMEAEGAAAALYGGKICKQHDHRRYFLRGRRFQIRVPVRYGYSLVLYSSGGVSGGICAQMACPRRVFHHQPG
ncbi:MATE family efflux transporter [Lachnoclostridium sp. An169]|uniref:MATE family efflux transporter n=1 Tax=Lachnoclostridium sp. An169 TaxID=1965569 RepID=UPI00269BA51D|nr:MATE family efflux transporter [Lachnoclostridium sp. An169]